MEHLGLIGLLVVLAATVRWFWRAWAVNVPKPYLFQVLLATGIALGIAALYFGTKDPFAPWAVGVGAVLIFLTATGAQRMGEEAIDVGDTIPSFSAFDDNNDEFSSESLNGSRALIKFFRGHW